MQPLCIHCVSLTMQIPYSVMEKRPSSTLSDQPSQPNPAATPSVTKYTPPHKRARHKKPRMPLHQGTTSNTPTLSAPCSSSTKKQHPKPHRTTSHAHKIASVAQCEVEQKTQLGTSPQSKADTHLAPLDGAASSSSVPLPILSRFAIPSLPPVMSFGGSHNIGVAGLPFTAFQLKAVSVMFAARMAARLQQGGATPCDPILLDVDDGVRDSSDGGIQGCIDHASSSCSRGDCLKETVHSQTCDVQEARRGRGGLEWTQQITKKQSLGATGNSDAAFDSIPQEMDREKRVDRRGARSKKQRPDAFVAIRISSPQIRSSLEYIQSSITSAERRLGPAMVSLDKLHLTLMVLKLGEEDERMAR